MIEFQGFFGIPQGVLWWLIVKDDRLVIFGGQVLDFLLDVAIHLCAESQREKFFSLLHMMVPVLVSSAAERCRIRPFGFDWCVLLCLAQSLAGNSCWEGGCVGSSLGFSKWEIHKIIFIKINSQLIICYRQIPSWSPLIIIYGWWLFWEASPKLYFHN